MFTRTKYRAKSLDQKLAKAECKVIMVPAAFTLMTGKDHWEVLLRARAIETETYVVATGMWGPYPDGKGAVLPGMYGITYNVKCGDRAFGWAGDHVEPGVSIDDDGHSGHVWSSRNFG